MISYDANILIYALENVSQYAEKARWVVKKGEQEGAVISVLLVQEFLTGSALRGKQVFENASWAIDQLRNAKIVSTDKHIVEKALEVTLRYGKKAYGYDAIHVATASVAGCGEFWTNDNKLKNVKIAGLQVKLLSELDRTKPE